MKTPETSKLFRKSVDPKSGVVSYVLDARIAEEQQSLYFTQKSMTEDGRFLVFRICGGERRNEYVLTRTGDPAGGNREEPA